MRSILKIVSTNLLGMLENTAKAVLKYIEINLYLDLMQKNKADSTNQLSSQHLRFEQITALQD